MSTKPSQNIPYTVVEDHSVAPQHQRLQKRYTLTTLLAIAVAVSGQWESVVSSLYQAILLGGPSSLFYGYLISCTATLFIAFSLGELASIWPTPAGQVRWTVALAPPKWRLALGWTAHWVLLMDYALCAVSVLYAAANQIVSLAILGNPSWNPQRWQSFLVAVCILVICFVVNTFTPRLLHHISLLGITFHFLGYFAVNITLLATTKEFNSPKLVFQTIDNQSGWSSDGVALLIGILPTIFGFLAIDSPVRFSEEVERPHLDVPRAVVWATLLSSGMALPLLLVLGFCMGDPSELLQSPIVQLNPLAQILYNNTGGNVAGICLCCTIVVVAFAASIDLLGALGRLIMAQARDNGIPYSSLFASIHPRWGVPVNGMILATVIELAIAAIYIGNATAFYGIISGLITLQILSFSIPICLHLFYRKTITYGPWSLGRFSKVASAAGLLLYGLIFVIMCLPMTMPVDAMNMNYASAITGGTVTLSTVLYFVWGRKKYAGMVGDEHGSALSCVEENHSANESDSARLSTPKERSIEAVG